MVDDPFPGGRPVFTGADLIHSYTRAEAIADGQLVDVTAQARRFGITCPVALTAAVFGRCVEVPKRRRRLESEDARLHDVLWMLTVAMRRASRVVYRIRCSVREGTRNVD